MTLIEMIYVLAILGSAVGGAATMIAQGLGPLPAVLGALAGGLAIPILFGSLFWVLSTLDDGFNGRPYWPACTTCGALEFTYDYALGPRVMRCRCGRAYVRQARRLREVLPGGASRPLMRWRPFRGWIRDDAPSATTPEDPPYRSDTAG